jgi:hypothetical protein
MDLRKVCIAAPIDLRWDPKTIVPPTHSLPYVHGEGPSQKLLPDGAFQHLPKMTELLNSILTCPFCSLIRASSLHDSLKDERSSEMKQVSTLWT